MLANRWLKQAGTWYYLNPSGSMRTGWFKQHGVWYWLNPKAAPWLLDGRRRLMESGTTSTDPARCLPIDGLTWAAHGIRSAHQAPCAPVGTKRDRRVIGLIRKPEPWLSVGARSMDASTCSLAAVLWSTTYGCRLGTAPVASSMARGMPCSSPRTMLRQNRMCRWEDGLAHSRWKDLLFRSEGRRRVAYGHVRRRWSSLLRRRFGHQANGMGQSLRNVVLPGSLERGHAHRLGFRGRFLVLSRSFDGGYADRLAAGER